MACNVPTCSSDTNWGSVSCSRILKLAVWGIVELFYDPLYLLRHGLPNLWSSAFLKSWEIFNLNHSEWPHKKGGGQLNKDASTLTKMLRGHRPWTKVVCWQFKMAHAAALTSSLFVLFLRQIFCRYLSGSGTERWHLCLAGELNQNWTWPAQMENSTRSGRALWSHLIDQMHWLFYQLYGYQ